TGQPARSLPCALNPILTYYAAVLIYFVAHHYGDDRFGFGSGPHSPLTRTGALDQAFGVTYERVDDGT
ncbi:MAG: hypothetical protein JXQ75_24035, partial [Phycisphaerae bacterium]|nr:hypothetical protein [Phycisphaerae bacterium]